MRKLLLVLFLGAVLSPLSLWAGNTGTLKGRVLLEADKSAAAGATIKVVGTSYGAKAKADGRFILMGIPAGKFELKISYLGDETTISFSLTADEVKELSDIKISSKEKTTDVVVVTADKINVSNQGSGVTMTGAALTNNREGLSSIVGATAGVQAKEDGYGIRGSRPNETSIRLDGVDVSNPLNGGFGAGGTSYFPMPSTYGASEVQVKTGGFSAEYGEAMGGVVNTSLKTGSTDFYEGYLRWRTDFNPLWGSQGAKLGLEERNGVLKAIDNGDGYKLNSSNSNTFDFGVGGPIPFMDKKGTFFLSSNYKTSDNNSGYDIKDPAGNSLSDLANKKSWVKRIDARFKFDIASSTSLVIGASYGLSSYENNSWGWLYSTSKGQGNNLNYNGSIANAFDGVAENIAKQNANNTKVMNLLARVKHTFESSWFNVTLSYNQNDDEDARKTSTDDPSFFSGYDLLKPQDLYTRTDAGNVTSGIDQISDHYTRFTRSGTVSDGYSMLDLPAVNPFTGYIEGDEAKTTNNPYGLYSDNFAKHTSAGGFEYRKTSYWQLDGAYEVIIDDDKFKHSVKTGFELRTYELHRHYNPSPWSDAAAFDVFTDQWGGNFYIPEDYATARAKTSKPYEPLRGSAYVQDQIQYKGIVFTPGLRVDYFDPNADYRTRTSTFVTVQDPTGFAKAEAKVYISPRINVVYPLTETSKLELSYGLYLKTPELQYMYDAFGTWNGTPGMLVGNPDMKAQRTSQYQLTYENQITEDMSLSISAYYKDIYNQLGTIYAMASPKPFYMYSTSEYGSSKGIEFTLEKQAFDNIYASVNYTLATNVGTSPSATSNYGRPVDPYTDKLAFPLAEFTMDNDMRHSINFALDFIWGNNEGPEVFGIQPIENTSINFSGVYNSGSPYTRYKRSGEPLSDYNEVRSPSYWKLDLRFIKEFNLADFFGEAAGKTKLQFFVDVNNLLNRTVATDLYPQTGDPDDNGSSFYTTKDQLASVTFYREANYVLASTFGADQYDSYGDRYYTSQGDYNTDGVVTMDEQFRSYRQFVLDNASSRRNYQTPRTVYFGLMFKF